MKVNGIELFFEKLEGNGNMNFVLLHNAGGNHLFFTHQVALLKKYGNVIWFDLPGHGESEGMSSYEMNDLSAVVNQLCKDLSLQNISLFGLNNGAVVVIDVALNYSLPIKNLILIDPPILMEKSFITEINGFINQLENKDYDKFVTSLVDALFIHTHSKNKEIAAKAFHDADKQALQNIFKGLINWDTNTVGKLKKLTYPTLCILTDEHHCTYDKLRQEAPQFEIGKVIGSKCWATLEVPDQLNAMIERFIILNK